VLVCVCLCLCLCLCVCVHAFIHTRITPPSFTVFKNCSSTTELLLLADPSALGVHDANGDLPLHLAVLEMNAVALEVRAVVVV